MPTPAEALTIEHIRNRLDAAFQPGAARAFDAVYQFTVDGLPCFHLVIERGTLTVGEGAHEAPSVTFFYDDLATAVGVVEGTLDPMTTFMAGRIRTDGNLILALQLGALFSAKVPS
jgi:putative sterol carrier protein